MKNKLLILIAVLALSCSSDNNSTSKTDLKLVTGINCRQNADDFALQFGNPNIFTSDKFVIYPNPAIENFNVSAQHDVTDVWVVPANAQKIYQNQNFGSILNSGLYTEQSISSHAGASLTGQSSTDLSVNIATLPKGYYRVFVKIDGMIYWDNIYKYSESEDNETQFNALTNFWN